MKRATRKRPNRWTEIGDRRNPQFIPRGGSYFQHDDRLQTDEEDEDEEESGDATPVAENGEKTEKPAASGDGTEPAASESGDVIAKPVRWIYSVTVFEYFKSFGFFLYLSTFLSVI